MKLLFSVPTGYHVRELILPLRRLLEADPDVTQIYVLTPAAPFHEQVFKGFSDKFIFQENPSTIAEHKKLMQTWQPNVVITNTIGHDELDYPILKAAQELKIKTLTFIASWDNVWKIERLLKNEKPVAVTDQFIVWNRMMHSHLLRIFPELTPQRVAIVGAPRLDYFWHADKIPGRQEIYNYLGFQDTARPLIHFTTTELYPMGYVVKAVRQAIDTDKIPGNPYLYASVHPGGNIDNHNDLKQYGAAVRYSFGRQENPPHPSFAYIPAEEDIYRLIGVFKHADVLINQSSTTALESLIANTPVINIKYGRSLDWWHWRRSMVYRDFSEHYADILEDSATYVVDSKLELIQAIKTALTNPGRKEIARQKTIQRMITATDGTAGQKVLNVIKQQTQ